MYTANIVARNQLLQYIFNHCLCWCKCFSSLYSRKCIFFLGNCSCIFCALSLLYCNCVVINLLKPNYSNCYIFSYRPDLPFLISNIRALWRSSLNKKVPKGDWPRTGDRWHCQNSSAETTFYVCLLKTIRSLLKEVNVSVITEWQTTNGIYRLYSP